jgi:hypothetical protein
MSSRSISISPTESITRYSRKHKIAMIFEYGWEKTLRHELTHVIQAETLGFELYEKIFKEIYLNKREIDPFELQAYYNEGN